MTGSMAWQRRQCRGRRRPSRRGSRPAALAFVLLLGHAACEVRQAVEPHVQVPLAEARVVLLHELGGPPSAVRRAVDACGCRAEQHVCEGMPCNTAPHGRATPSQAGSRRIRGAGMACTSFVHKIPSRLRHVHPTPPAGAAEQMARKNMMTDRAWQILQRSMQKVARDEQAGVSQSALAPSSHTRGPRSAVNHAFIRSDHGVQSASGDPRFRCPRRRGSSQPQARRGDAARPWGHPLVHGRHHASRPRRGPRIDGRPRGTRRGRLASPGRRPARTRAGRRPARARSAPRLVARSPEVVRAVDRLQVALAQTCVSSCGRDAGIQIHASGGSGVGVNG